MCYIPLLDWLPLSLEFIMEPNVYHLWVYYENVIGECMMCKGDFLNVNNMQNSCITDVEEERYNT